MVTSGMESGRSVDWMKPTEPGGTAEGGDREVAAADRFRKLTLPVDVPDTGRAAREMVTLTLNNWGLAELADDVRSCVAELVGNAREHAIPDKRSPLRGPVVTVTLRLSPDWLLVGVADEDSTPPMLPESEPFTAEFTNDLPEEALPDGGRGLHIVRCLSDSVWWAPCGEGGKSVFCRFALDGRSAPA